MKRKFLSVSGNSSGQFAVATDGTAWCRFGVGDWYRLPDLPPIEDLRELAEEPKPARRHPLHDAEM